jgi:hypothetical protein
VHTDGALPVERTEPATAQAKHDQDELWYDLLNDECDCDLAVKCGDKYKTLVKKITAEGAMSTSQQRAKLHKAVYDCKRFWRADSKHYSKQSATCDHAHMPRELLPRLGRNNTVTPDEWPYLSQRIVNDVRAMRCIRSTQAIAHYSTMWRTLQPRLQQYATTGAGTVAEAIVTNYYWWSGQVAHEKPSDGISQARKRRHST